MIEQKSTGMVRGRRGSMPARLRMASTSAYLTAVETVTEIRMLTEGVLA